MHILTFLHNEKTMYLVWQNLLLKQEEKTSHNLLLHLLLLLLLLATILFTIFFNQNLSDKSSVHLNILILIKRMETQPKNLISQKLLLQKKTDLTWKTKTSFGAHQAHQALC